MAISSTTDVLFKLLRIATGVDSDYSLPSIVNWGEVINLSCTHGVGAIAVDGLQRIYDSLAFGGNGPGLSADDNKLSALDDLDSPQIEEDKYGWFHCTFQSEADYEQHVAAIGQLASLYSEKNLRMLLLKGYGLSLNYPIPAHRSSGDIDVYMFGDGSDADKWLHLAKGIEPKQNEDKHSSFKFNGVSVENHACLVNDTVFPALRELNEALEKESALSSAVEVNGATVYIPSVTFNALFLPYHCAGHFAHGEASLRQLCDWACFVQKYGGEIDWNRVRSVVEHVGYFSFFCCLNSIVKNYLGVPSSCLPDWPCDVDLAEKVVNDIVSPRRERKSLFGKVIRFFSSRWKYRMVYRDNMFLTAVRLAKSYLRLKNDRAVSIWEK